MTEDVPPWLTEGFLASVIQDGELAIPKVVVKDFTVSPAVAKGNNYMSIAYRVRAKYVEKERIGDESATNSNEETKTAALIIKAPITTGVVSEFQERTSILEVEPRMYNEVLPKINEMLGCQLSPKSFYCPLKNGMFIVNDGAKSLEACVRTFAVIQVLADLSASGYVMGVKHRQLDLAHCEALLGALGRYHAATVRLQRVEPILVGELGRERMYVEDGPLSADMRPWLTGGATALGGMVTALPGCQRIGKHILGRANELPESMVEICKRRADRFNVLNHGDLWVNNLLFKHGQEGNVEDIKLIDFQLVRWASPALDILYFIWTSANEESRNRVPDLLSTYLQSLNDTLDKLGCDERLSRKALETEMLAASDWAIMVISCTLPILLCDTEDALDIKNADEGESRGDELAKKFKSLYGGKNLNAVLPAIMRQFQQWLL